MAVITIPSPAALSTLVPIPPPQSAWPGDAVPSSSSSAGSTSSSSGPDPIVVRLDVDSANKENRPRRRAASDTLVLRLKAPKRQKIERDVEDQNQLQATWCRTRHEEVHDHAPPCSKRTPMKAFQEDYLSALKYDPAQEHKREKKVLRFACFAQVKEIPSHRDLAAEDKELLYNGLDLIRENARRNTKEMYHDASDRFGILEGALEEDAFYIVQCPESGVTEYIHPASYGDYLEQSAEDEEDDLEPYDFNVDEEMDAFVAQHRDFFEGTFRECITEDGCLSNKTCEDEFSTIFCCGGTSRAYEADFGFDDAVDLENDGI